MDIIVGGTSPSPEDIARQNVIGLNTAMFGFVANAAVGFEQNILAQHPVILALFSGTGGRFILYRPGMEPIEAPRVPEVYELLKSIGHATMVLTMLAGPHIDKPEDHSWKASMQAFRARLQVALDGLDETGIRAEWIEDCRAILAEDIAFIDASVSAGAISYSEITRFADTQGPRLKRIVKWAAQTQVAHWMAVTAEWKEMLGEDWDKTYAASNTIYVARQNNILFGVLAQFFGPEAINSRLMLFETTDFTVTPPDLLRSLTRVMADRRVGELFFGNLAVMDFELMGGDGRDAIVAEAEKLGITPFLPPLVPFGSNQWPGLITPGEGPGSLSQLP